MKTLTNLHAEDASAALVTRKLIQNRGSGNKPVSHRYERRKVREFLRHGGEVVETAGR